MAKIQYNGKQYSLIIPKAYIDQTKWKKGTIVTISFNERGNLELKEVK